MALQPGETMRKPCPCQHLSYQPCVERHSRRANEAGLNFGKCFFCFSSSPTTDSSTGIPCYFPMHSELQISPHPKTPFQWEGVLVADSACGLTSHCCPSVPKEVDMCGKGMCLLYHHLGKDLAQRNCCLDARKSCFPAERMQTSTRGLVEPPVLEIPQT